MTSHLDKAVQARELASVLKGFDQRLANLERAAQLPYSAARGQLHVVDDNGAVISTVGRQADGSVGVTVTESSPLQPRSPRSSSQPRRACASPGTACGPTPTTPRSTSPTSRSTSARSPTSRPAR
ncbi:hypothetical protein ACFQ0M_48110 [Kitasatospora aburaviensis]